MESTTTGNNVVKEEKFVVNEEQIVISYKSYLTNIMLFLIIFISSMSSIPGGNGTLMGIDLYYFDLVFNLVSENSFVHFFLFIITTYLFFTVPIFFYIPAKDLVLNMSSNQTIIDKDKVTKNCKYLFIPLKYTIQLSSNPDIIVEENKIKIVDKDNEIEIPFKSDNEKNQILERLNK